MRTLWPRPGSPILIGAPARPVHQELAKAISSLCRSLPGIGEAHLPQCFLLGVMMGPAQVLVIVYTQGSDLTSIQRGLTLGLSRILPPGSDLDIWPIPYGHDLLDDIRSTGCRIL
jgi:hypothetical protein